MTQPNCDKIVKTLESAPGLGVGRLYKLASSRTDCTCPGCEAVRAGARYCAVGWLLHEAGVLDHDLVLQSALTQIQCGVLFQHYGLRETHVEELIRVNDGEGSTATPESRQKLVIEAARSLCNGDRQ